MRGPPIGLGWTYYKDILESDIDSYEAYRDSTDCRRTRCDLRVPADVRTDMLLESGVTLREIRAATKRVQEDNKRKFASLSRRKYDKIFEAGERLKNGINKTKKRFSQESQRLTYLNARIMCAYHTV